MGEGAEFLENRPAKDGRGQYTKKFYHLQSKVPSIICKLVPKRALQLQEHSWNTFPTSETTISNPSFLKDKFEIRVKSVVIGDNWNDLENVFELSEEDLEQREVVLIDFATHEISDADRVDGEDPTRFRSEEAQRGPLRNRWINRHRPVTCIYKLIRCKFHQWPFEKKVTEKIMDLQEWMVVVFHQRLFCWMDEWFKLNIEEIRILEKEIQDELNHKRNTGKLIEMK